MKPLKILVACECSGRVRDAFRRRGHDAISCDLRPTEQPGPHYQGDVLDILGEAWDMMIAHPDCTYLTNSGVHWLHKDASRWPKLFQGAEFFRTLHRAKHIKKIVVENPIPHKYALQLIGERSRTEESMGESASHAARPESRARSQRYLCGNCRGLRRTVGSN